MKNTSYSIINISEGAEVTRNDSFTLGLVTAIALRSAAAAKDFENCILGIQYMKGVCTVCVCMQPRDVTKSIIQSYCEALDPNITVQYIMFRRNWEDACLDLAKALEKCIKVMEKTGTKRFAPAINQARSALERQKTT